MVVLGIVVEVGTALDAQAQAVGPAHGLERQLQHDGVPQHRLEVDQITVQSAASSSVASLPG